MAGGIPVTVVREMKRQRPSVALQARAHVDHVASCFTQPRHERLVHVCSVPPLVRRAHPEAA
jgi:hypothetical protein